MAMSGAPAAANSRSASLWRHEQDGVGAGLLRRLRVFDRHEAPLGGNAGDDLQAPAGLPDLLRHDADHPGAFVGSERHDLAGVPIRDNPLQAAHGAEFADVPAETGFIQRFVFTKGTQGGGEYAFPRIFLPLAHCALLLVHRAHSLCMYDADYATILRPRVWPIVLLAIWQFVLWFPGMDWEGVTVRIDWTRCTRRRWPPTRSLQFTPHERRKRRNVLLYFWAGRGERKLPSGPVAIHTGLCHWSRPGWIYSCTQSPRNPLGVTAIHFDLLDKSGEVIPADSAHLPPEQLAVRSPHLVEEVTRWIAERAMDARAGMVLPPDLEVAATSLLRGLLIKLSHDTPATPRPQAAGNPVAWRRFTAHIQEHLHDLGGVNQLAEKAGYTRSHFCRLFKAHTGLSPRQYVINARTALAKELLRGTSLSVSDVAVRAGHGELSPFSKQFKRHTGMTPSAYRISTRA